MMEDIMNKKDLPMMIAMLSAMVSMGTVAVMLLMKVWG